ncbi:hypothetical protein L7F22_025406 [Adiantum nelumboides]|nr:hypothetical protein [Adiantum nelumboides]
MDAAKKKAFFKSRMREAAQKREKRIESPLVRYDDLGQPVCRVCNVAVKSESLWPAHLASRLHKEAADRLKTQAKEATVAPGTGRQLNSTEATTTKETPVTGQLNATLTTKAGPRVSSSLPDDFWDQPQAKRASTARVFSQWFYCWSFRRHRLALHLQSVPAVADFGNPNFGVAVSGEVFGGSAVCAQLVIVPLPECLAVAILYLYALSRPASVSVKDTEVEDRISEELASIDAISKNNAEPLKLLSTADVQVHQPGESGALSKEGVQNSLPEGFFDNVEADFRARGLEPPKYNIQNEWKDFEKSIRDDLQEMDLRLEEEEFDAAEDREQLESLQQRELLDRVEKLKKNKHEKVETAEISEVIAKVASRKPFMNVNLSLNEDSSSDGDSENENALLDWRAKQF